MRKNKNRIRRFIAGSRAQLRGQREELRIREAPTNSFRRGRVSRGVFKNLLRVLVPSRGLRARRGRGRIV